MIIITIPTGQETVSQLQSKLECHTLSQKIEEINAEYESEGQKWFSVFLIMFI